MVELSRPAPGDRTFTVHSPPDGQVTEEEQSEFPEGMQREKRSRFYLLIPSLRFLARGLVSSDKMAAKCR